MGSRILNLNFWNVGDADGLYYRPLLKAISATTATCGGWFSCFVFLSQEDHWHGVRMLGLPFNLLQAPSNLLHLRSNVFKIELDYRYWDEAKSTWLMTDGLYRRHLVWEILYNHFLEMLTIGYILQVWGLASEMFAKQYACILYCSSEWKSWYEG